MRSEGFTGRSNLARLKEWGRCWEHLPCDSARSSSRSRNQSRSSVPSSGAGMSISSWTPSSSCLGGVDYPPHRTLERTGQRSASRYAKPACCGMLYHIPYISDRTYCVGFGSLQDLWRSDRAFRRTKKRVGRRDPSWIAAPGTIRSSPGLQPGSASTPPRPMAQPAPGSGRTCRESG